MHGIGQNGNEATERRTSFSRHNERKNKAEAASRAATHALTHA